MKPLLLAVVSILLVANAFSQVEIKLDKVYNGQAYFTIVDKESIERIENGEDLFIWGWSAHQLDTLDDGDMYINGYNKNFQLTSSSTFKSISYWKIPLGRSSWVWATFDQEYGHRPPELMRFAANKVEFQNNSLGLPVYLESYLHSQKPLKETVNESISARLVPNPATSGNVKICFDKKYDFYSAKIFDLNGKSVYDHFDWMDGILTDQVDIDIHSLHSGTYIVQVKLKDKILNRKLVITD